MTQLDLFTPAPAATPDPTPNPSPVRGGESVHRLVVNSSPLPLGEGPGVGSGVAAGAVNLPRIRIDADGHFAVRCGSCGGAATCQRLRGAADPYISGINCPHWQPADTGH